jgi:tRNA1(Val) A37 N6-methylase TrmN6
MGDLFASYMVEEEILEHNLYGVDINEDAVEIAKLSLWLRTAKRGRPLTKLADKIVCANSLLEMPFSENSFDVVIGNPPYFNIQTFGAKSPMAQAIQNKYPEIWQDKSDILFYFIALAIKLTKNKVGFIVSNAFMFSDKAQKLRNFILENSNISKITNFEKYMVFEDASVTTAIIELDKNKKSNKTLAYNFIEKNYSQHDVYEVLTKQNEYFEIKLKQDSVYALVDNEINSINEKIDKNYSKLNEIFKIGKGMETAANDVFIFKNYPNNFPKEFIKKRMSGEIIGKYEIKDLKEFIIYFENVEKFEDLPTEIQNHLLENKEFLENRATVKNEGRIWWRYSRPMHKDFYHLNKIWCSYRAKENIFCFDDTKEYIGLTNTTVIFDTNEDLDLKYLLALLNSKTLNFRYKSIGKQTGSGVYEYFENGVGKLPIPKIDEESQKPFINLVDEILEAKQKIKDYKPLLDEAIKNNNFDREIALKKELENLENICTTNEKTIDQMVYKLYDLTPDEIKIVESS